MTMVMIDLIEMEIPISLSLNPRPPSLTGVKVNKGWRAVCAPPSKDRMAKENIKALIFGVRRCLYDTSLALSSSRVSLVRGGSVSLSHIAAMMATVKGNKAARRFGKRYGYVAKIGKVLAKFGNDFDEPNVPPMKDAIRIPMFKQRGKKENALASLVSSEISPLHISQMLLGTSCVEHSHYALEYSDIAIHHSIQTPRNHQHPKALTKPKRNGRYRRPQTSLPISSTHPT